MVVVSRVFHAIDGFAGHVNSEAADGLVVDRQRDIGLGMENGVERLAVVFEGDAQFCSVDLEGDADFVFFAVGEGVGNDVGDQFFESEIQSQEGSWRQRVVGSKALERFVNALRFCPGILDDDFQAADGIRLRRVESSRRGDRGSRSFRE
jgi:hypothetical protein